MDDEDEDDEVLLPPINMEVNNGRYINRVEVIEVKERSFLQDGGHEAIDFHVI